MRAKPDGDGAELKIGDTVQITTGERGKIVHISRMTYFVAFQNKAADDTLTGLLGSELVKVEDGPDQPQ